MPMNTSHLNDVWSKAGKEFDANLIARVASKERAALGELYDRHAAQMLALAIRILRNRRDAEDLVHDVFLEVWHKAETYEPTRGAVRSWILMRARSRAIDRLRALETTRNYMIAEKISKADDVQSSLAADRLIDEGCTRKAIAALSKPLREVVDLCYFEGLTCREVAARCGIPLGTVKSRLSAALARLRLELQSVKETH